MGEAGDRIVRGQDPQFDQGSHGGQKARGVAARVGHPLGEADALPLAREQFGKAVHPARLGAVGGGGVQDPGAGVLHQGDGLPGGVLRQAQEDQVGGVQELFPLLHVPALVRVDDEKLQVVPLGQQLVDLRAHYAAFAVDKNFRSVRGWSPP